MFCTTQAGLPNALIRVIVTSDTVLSVRAAVLLGQFLHLVSVLYMFDICSNRLYFPGLLIAATRNCSHSQLPAAALVAHVCGGGALLPCGEDARHRRSLAPSQASSAEKERA